ncbi:NlpC/P60 family protein [Streptomyces sp. SL13]|uniref:NlpC/P60 family protein n=1 Tax=Streptantibioticus silvisoli TaxID=2705255 RepID=A0AA90K911_9ACTN|nr:NlpC/P60 family protein [Streptantibioticus silvisoli]MDI5963530.1 NlpC/P60 family protein [Streptantibioticus silvisoli]MDI5970197.1 NlpC/P60 family protein [Streptantibioticus silvisoli]
MASHRRPKPASRTRVTVLTATAAAAVALSSQAANAAPAPAKPTVKDVKSQVTDLNNAAEKATQQYDGAKERQDKLQAQVSQLQNKVAKEQAQLNKLADSFGTMASAQYRDGGVDPTMQLFLSADPSDYLAKASMLDQLSGTQADELKQIETQKRILDQERAEAGAKLSQLASVRKELAAKKTDVQAKLAKAQHLLDTLTPVAREEFNNAGTITDPPPVDATGRAAAALAAGATKIGSPYVYGATGPSSFDCSGFVQWSYAQVGISLPRTSEEQENVGPHLSLSQLQPGDLVIMYGGEHVGMYAGNGIVLHAPHTGAYVRYEKLSDMPFDFGVRVV